MLLGVALGAVFPNVGKAEWMAALSNVFLRLIKSIIAPLIFGTLVYGIAGTGSVKTMGRIGIKAILYFEVLTTIALVLGLGAVNLVRPGEGMTLERTAGETGLSQAGPTLSGTLEHTFPASVIDAMAKGDVLQIVVFSFLFGAACAAIGSKATPVVDVLQIALRSDVPLHQVRDVPGAHRRGRSHGGDDRQQGHGRTVGTR